MFRRCIAIIIVLTMIAALVPIPLTDDDGGSGGGSARADGGMIPYYGYSLNEPGQKAIIGWNGEEEVMLLSVDVRADYEIKALHVVPFPTLPEVTLGSNESFAVVENITDSYRYESLYDRYENDGESLGAGNESAYDMVFYDSIGPHDITVMRVNDSDEFTGWVDSFLQENDMGWEYNVSLVTSIIDTYVEADIRYFAFDVIDLGLDNRTVDPLVYRFRTDSLFFPLHISSMIEGYSEVALALVTPQDMPMSVQQMTDMRFHRILNIRLSRAEVEAIDGTIAGLFPGDGTLSMFHRNMYLPGLKADIALGRGIDGVKWRATCLDNRATYRMGDVSGDGVDDVVSCCYGGLHVIDGRTGGTLWTYEDPALYEIEYDWRNVERVTYACEPVLVDANNDGKADVVCYSSGNITVLNGPDGSPLWEDRELLTGEPNVWSADMDADDGPELVLVDDDGIKVLNAENGTLIWSFNTNFGPNYPVMELADVDPDTAMEVLASKGNVLYALDGGNGETLWTHDMEHERRVNVGDDFSCPTTVEVVNLDGKGPSEVVVVPGDMMSVLDASDGSFLWEYTNPSSLGFLHHLKSSDVDGDGGAEVLIYEQAENRDYQVIALGPAQGGVEWSYDTEYRYLSRPQVGDVDNDGTDEVIVRYTDYDHQEFYVLDGDGSELWTWDGVETWNYWMSILDEDIGGHPVVLAIVEGDLRAYDGSDGTHLWTYKVDYDADFWGSYADLHDIDGDGDRELVARLGDRLHFLEPEGLTPLLNLTTGESLDSYTIGDFNDDGQEEVMAFCSGAFYCFGDENPFMVLDALTYDVEPGGDTSLVVYYGDGSFAVTGSTIAMSDNGAGGSFSEVAAQGGGIHTCNYTAPPTAVPGTTINITASAETATGTITSNEVLLTVIDGGTGPDPGGQTVPSADRMTMDVASVEQEWLSGTTAEIMIGISNGTEPVDNVTLFVSADVEGGGVLSTETVGQGMYYVTYQLPEGFAGNLTIYVLATHPTFGPAVGAVVLTVVDDEAPVTPVEPEELLFQISAFPATPYEGDTIALLLGLFQGDIGLEGAYFDLDDSGAGGMFSEPDGMGGGYYSLQYDPPEGYVGEINISGSATPGDGSFAGAYTIITIVERPGPEEPNAPAGLKIFVDTITGSCLSGGVCAWMVYASAGDIPVEGATMELSDVRVGGSFDGSVELSSGYYIVSYSTPESMDGDINISIRLTSGEYGSDRVWVNAMLEGGTPGGEGPEDGADEDGDKGGDAGGEGVTPMTQVLMILLLVLIMLVNVMYWRRQKGGEPGDDDKGGPKPSEPPGDEGMSREAEVEEMQDEGGDEEGGKVEEGVEREMKKAQ